MSVNRLRLDDVANACRTCAKCNLGRRVYNGKVSNLALDQNRTPAYMIVGCAPTMEDLDAGEVFGNKAFKDFEKCLYDATGLMREDIYLTNLCKCCLYGTRKPVDAEIRKCSEYLSEEIEAIRPNLVIGLGKMVLKAMTNVDDLDKYHGQFLFSQKYKTRVFSTYVPTLKRMGNEESYKSLMADLSALAQDIRGGSCRNG